MIIVIAFQFCEELVIYVQSAHAGLSDVTSEHRCHVIRSVCYVSEPYCTRLATLR